MIAFITQILKVEPFKVLCLWNTNELRVIDFEKFWHEWDNEKDQNVFFLKDYEVFKEVLLNEAGTLQWQNIQIPLVFRGQKKIYPLELDSVVLYEKSISFQNYRLEYLEKI